jgi:hypothetical protein
MQKQSRTHVVLLSLAFVLAVTALPVLAQDPNARVAQIRRELLKLPYYGVFDFLAFSYDRGTVTLMGYAYRPTLKNDAERAVKRTPGVDVVKNQIEVLPVSQSDDDIRWAAYYKIYGDPFLSKYAPGGGSLWGLRRDLMGSSLLGIGVGPFLGMEPAGDYPIHIIVKGSRITLLGVVDNEADKTVAGMRAREISGVFKVDNQLALYGEKASQH